VNGRPKPSPQARAARLARLAALALALASPLGARAHEVLHEVRPGGAVAFRARYADGQVLAYAQYELWSPVDAKIPWQKGRTDREGWLAFVAEPPGAWRVRVVGADGHGLDTVVQVAAHSGTATTQSGLAMAQSGLATTQPAPSPAEPRSVGASGRTLLGLLLIGALFGGLILLYRRKAP